MWKALRLKPYIKRNIWNTEAYTDQLYVGVFSVEYSHLLIAFYWGSRWSVVLAYGFESRIYHDCSHQFFKHLTSQNQGIRACEYLTLLDFTKKQKSWKWGLYWERRRVTSTARAAAATYGRWTPSSSCSRLCRRSTPTIWRCGPLQAFRV